MSLLKVTNFIIGYLGSQGIKMLDCTCGPGFESQALHLHSKELGFWTKKEVSLDN